MRAFVLSAPGEGKARCEDAAVINGEIVCGDIADIGLADFSCIGILDGVGGNAGGKEASMLLAGIVASADFSGVDEAGLLLFAESANAALIEKAGSMVGMEGMATTLSCLVNSKKGVFLVHAGNTRVYALQGSYLRQVTSDHTMAGFNLRQGLAEKAAACPKNVIDCCFGGGNARYMDGIEILKAYDGPSDLPLVTLFTSDGIHDYVEVEEMEDTLARCATDEQIAKCLVNSATSKGSGDDKTVIILRR